MRSAPAFSDIRVKPSFLRTTAAKKPRTECCCQPVAFMMAAIVVPSGCLSRARIASCLVPPRVEPDGMFLGFAGLFVRLFARANLVFVRMVLVDICGSFSVATAPGAVTTEAPQWRHRQRGRIPDEAPTGILISAWHSDAPIAPEVHSFLRGKLSSDRPTVCGQNPFLEVPFRGVISEAIFDAGKDDASQWARLFPEDQTLPPLVTALQSDSKLDRGRAAAALSGAAVVLKAP